MAVKFERSEDGQVKNPPVIREHERLISEIAASGDQDRLTVAYKRYQDDQAALVKELERAGDEDKDAPGTVDPVSSKQVAAATAEDGGKNK